MRHLQALALAALAIPACAGYVYYGWGYYPCDAHYHDDSCHDYDYAVWQPSELAATDFDGDGRLDAVVADGATGILWFARGKAGGGFGDLPTAPFTLNAPGASVAAVNADGDDSPDLLVLEGSPGALATWIGDGHGGFMPLSTAQLLAPTTPGVVRFARGMLDDDAIDDVVTLDETGAIHVALGTGSGGFVDVGAGDPASTFLGSDVGARVDQVFIALADFDDRQGTDLLVLDGESAAFAVLSGRGDGTFDAARSVTTAPLGSVLAVAAVTVSLGRPADLAVLSGDRGFVGARSTLAVVRYYDGTSRLEPMDVGTARSILPSDLDGDGLTDLLLTDTSNRAIRTLLARRPARGG